MLWDLIRSFQGIVEQQAFCRARLYVNGLATQVTIMYLPNDGMEIRGLPSGLPASIKFEGAKVSLPPRPFRDEEEEGFYQLYRTWDPRVIARAEPMEEFEPLESRWKARYDIRKAIRLHPKTEERIKVFIEELQEVEFVTDGPRLRELSEWDFSAYPTRLTLVFEYPDGR